MQLTSSEKHHEPLASNLYCSGSSVSHWLCRCSANHLFGRCKVGNGLKMKGVMKKSFFYSTRGNQLVWIDCILASYRFPSYRYNCGFGRLSNQGWSKRMDYILPSSEYNDLKIGLWGGQAKMEQITLVMYWKPRSKEAQGIR